MPLRVDTWSQGVFPASPQTATMGLYSFDSNGNHIVPRIPDVFSISYEWDGLLHLSKNIHCLSGSMEAVKKQDRPIECSCYVMITILKMWYCYLWYLLYTSLYGISRPLIGLSSSMKPRWLMLHYNCFFIKN